MDDACDEWIKKITGDNKVDILTHMTRGEKGSIVAGVAVL
jgi:hypothetical protein